MNRQGLKSAKDHWKTITEEKKGTDKRQPKSPHPWKPTREVRVPPKLFENLQEFQSGASFEQDDVPLVHDMRKDRRVSRGGYRFYGAVRNMYDYCGPDSVKNEENEAGQSSDQESFIQDSDEIDPNENPDESTSYEPRQLKQTSEKKVKKETTDTGSFKGWIYHTSAHPEYQQQSRAKEYHKPGTSRSHHDYDSSEQEEVDYKSYYKRPEVHNLRKIREYRHYGTHSSPFDDDDEPIASDAQKSKSTAQRFKDEISYEGENRLNEIRAQQIRRKPQLPSPSTVQRRSEKSIRPLDKQFQKRSSAAAAPLQTLRPMQSAKQNIPNDGKLTSSAKTLVRRMSGQSPSVCEYLAHEDMDITHHHNHPNDYGTSHFTEYEEVSTQNGRNTYEKSCEHFSHIHHSED